MDDETAEFDSFLQPQEPPNSIEKCKTGAQKNKLRKNFAQPLTL